MLKWALVGGPLVAAIAFLLWSEATWRERTTAGHRAGRALVDIAGRERFTEARLSESVDWAQPPEVRHRGTRSPLPLTTVRAVLLVRARFEGDPSSDSLRATALADLIEGRLDDAIATLERASAGEPAFRARTNLSAAYYERWRQDGRPADLVRSLDAISRAAESAPRDQATMFDEALVLDALGLAQQAEHVWLGYLERDPRSAWATEARQRLIRRRGPSPQPPPDQLSRYLTHWANGHDRDGDEGLTPAQLLTISAGARDTVLPALVRLVQEASHWDPDRRACLRAMISSREAARAAFDEAQLAVAEQLLHTAIDEAHCAGVQLPELTALLLQAKVNETRDPHLLAQLQAEEVPAMARGNWEVVGRIRQSAGAAAIRSTQFDRAIADDQAAIKAYQLAGDEGSAAAVYSSLGEAFCLQGDFSRAWDNHAAALSRLGQMRSYRQVHTALSIAASCAETMEVPGTALLLARELESLALRHGNGAGLVMSRLYQARSVAKLATPARAVPLLDSAYEALAAVADPSLRRAYATEVSWVRGRILQEARPQQAIASLNDAYTWYEATGNRSRLAEVLLARGTAEAAMGNTSAADKTWSDGVAIAEQQRAGSAQPDLQISRLSQLWDLFGNLIELRKGNPVAALSAWERGRARVLLDALAGAHRIEPLSGENLYRWLPSHTTVLAYSMHRDELLVFVITHDGVMLAAHPITQAALEAELARYVEQLQNGHAPSNAHWLSELLLPVDAADLRRGELVLIPDGRLHAFPFATLPYGDRQRPLVDGTVPVIAASLTTLRLRRVTAPTSRPHVLLIAADGGSPRRDLPSLPGARGEIERIARLYPRARALNGPDATRAAVLSVLDDADLVHFAGHAIVNERFPAGSGIIVAGGAGDDLVSAAEVAAVRLHPGMTAILSACDTARGAIAGGEGVASLARAFSAAGAGAVIATLWRVPDDATSDFMFGLHAELRQGLSPAEALARSQRAAIHAGVTTSVWGAFQVHGGIVTGEQ